jgi:hyperosmotically inducible periplasmic protein
MSATTRREWMSRAAAAMIVGALGLGAAPRAAAQSSTDASRIEAIRRALTRLPYYGVFDFLAFKYERGTVTLLGYAYAPRLKEDAEAAVKRAPGVDTVVNEIETLPTSLNDDRIRRDTFAAIYTDDFLSRYAPGGAMQARYDAIQFSRWPGMQPFGTYPMHIVVKGGRVTLVGVVDNASDKQIAEVRARQVTGVFGVENELLVATSRR